MLFNSWAWDKLFRRDFVMKNGLLFQEQRTTNDLFFVMTAMAAAERISVLPDVLIHQRVNHKTSLNATREKSWDCFYKALIALKDWLTERHLYDSLQQDFANLSLHVALWNLNTLQYPVQEVCYNNLINAWFRNLDITDHSADFFFNKEEYSQLCAMKKQTYSEYFPHAKQDFELRSGEKNSAANTNRKFRTLLQCYREHGFRYTLKTIAYYLRSR